MKLYVVQFGLAPNSTRDEAMQSSLHAAPGISVHSQPLKLKKKTGKDRVGCVCLHRLPPEGHASLKLGLRANALEAFRIQPAWRFAAARDPSVRSAGAQRQSSIALM
jgi:hypothetical protein